MTGDGSQNDSDLISKVGRTVIEDMLKNKGFNKNNFQSEKPLHIGWLATPIIIYLVICAYLLWGVTKGTNGYLFVFIIGILSIAWVAGVVQKKASNTTITIIVGIATFAGLLLAGNVMTPAETADTATKIINGKKNSD